jgi:PKD repeat protein
MRIWTRTVLLGVVTALAACGGGEQEPSKTTTTAPAPAATPSPAPGAAAPAEEGEPVSIFLDADVIEGKAPLTVHFDVDLDGGVAPFSWSWDYGDGNTGDAADPKHSYTYEQPGVYMVELEVADAAGDSDFDILEIEVFAE